MLGWYKSLCCALAKGFLPFLSPDLLYTNAVFGLLSRLYAALQSNMAMVCLAENPGRSDTA